MASGIKSTWMLWGLWIAYAGAFSWGRTPSATSQSQPNLSTAGHMHLTQTPQSGVQHGGGGGGGNQLRNMYALALTELQELEAEPLCHRVAARLLVGNCQLVDGKDEATILTDSGRRIRDFVDSYAASLAICDLERGRFDIPRECAKFREPALSQIALRSERESPVQMHVTSDEIGLCLSALAMSDAAWSTWVSYRHKALRFCEAARVEREKDQNILLYQRLTHVLSTLTEGVEAELQKRMDELDRRARQSAETLESLRPRIDRLIEGLHHAENILAGNLEAALKKSTDSINNGFQHAESLQQILGMLVRNALESNANLAHAHEASLQQTSKRAADEMSAMVAVVATAISSSMALQDQMERSNQQAAELARRQENLEASIDRVLEKTQSLSSSHAHHAFMLKQAANLTSDILDTLEETVTTASSVNESLLKDANVGSWWPYIVCPTASLVMGSYGLPPSAYRNLGLLALGEAFGFLVSSTNEIHAMANRAKASVFNTDSFSFSFWRAGHVPSMNLTNTTVSLL